LYVTGNDWTPEIAAMFLAVHLDGAAKAFYSQLALTDPETVRRITALLTRYGGEMAILRRCCVCNECRRRAGET